jgi:hypothetical protein
MAIEILENTLLKLLVRRGTNADRQEITLESGELGYTTDTDRLFIGDGTTAGGVLVGNKYKGAAGDVTSLSPVDVGDYVYDNDDNVLYICTTNDGSSQGDWTAVANSLSALDSTIIIDNKSRGRVGKTSDGGGLSAGNISNSALGASLQLDTSDKVTLSSAISVDAIYRSTTTVNSFLSLPAELKISEIDYTFPGAAPTADSFLGADAAGALNWGIPGVVTSGVAPTTGALVPVGTIVPYVSAAGNVPYGWLPCDGRSVNTADFPDLSGVIHYAYGGSGTTFKVPNLTNKAVYGSSDPENSTLYSLTTAYDHAVTLSAFGMMFIIKAMGGITSPTLTITKNLGCTINGDLGRTDVEFDPLSGDIVIERAQPGMEIFDKNVGGASFTFPSSIHYVKYYVTGAGAQGGNVTGGAAATVIGYLSAWPGAVFDIDVGSPSINKGGQGGLSKISKDSNVIVQSDGGQVGGVPGYGSVSTSSIYTLTGGYVLSGAGGSIPTSITNAQANGSPSYWGGTGTPGAGGGSEAGDAWGIQRGNTKVVDGIVMFEWS